MRDLAELRQEIDEIDAQMVKLFLLNIFYRKNRKLIQSSGID